MATSRRMQLPIVTASTLQPERAASPMSSQLVWRWRLANLSRRARDGQPESGGPSRAVDLAWRQAAPITAGAADRRYRRRCRTLPVVMAS